MTTSTRQTYPDPEDIQGDVWRLDFDPDYARLLEGKSVVAVGPAETMLGTGRGREIDTFDLVVRFNTALEYVPFAEDLARDIGTRTDILYCNPEVLGDRIVMQQALPHARFVRACEVAGIKYFVCTNNDYNDGSAGAASSEGRARLGEFRRLLSDHRIRARSMMLSSTPSVVRGWLRGYIGRTGFIGIVDLLRYGVSRLHVTGMTFYHKGGHLFLEDCVGELDPMRNHRGIMPTHMLGHNSYLELQILRTLAGCFDQRLELDEHMRRLMEAGGGPSAAA